MVHSTRRAGTVLVALMLDSVLLLALAPVSQGQPPVGRPAEAVVLHGEELGGPGASAEPSGGGRA